MKLNPVQHHVQRDTILSSFRNDNIRTHYFGPSTIFRHREAVIGILEFLVENPDISNVHFSSRCIYIIQYFNRLGAVKQLAYMDRYFFKEEFG